MQALHSAGGQWFWRGEIVTINRPLRHNRKNHQAHEGVSGGAKMINLVTQTDPRPLAYNSLRFKYWNANTFRDHDRVLSIKGLLQARKSGNNCEWSVYVPGFGWHTDFVFTYDIRIPNEITITILNKKGE
jgi:hypothetical protein